ncbi:uncharacterized protein APUU_50063A [Aspergillus puulaauensis]|uniref:F-box domain-containing protein n=1 Tax=Aspergillus puulaauensis TaxID=1220207 RepID=A0A7R7XQ51_9EURO|nr:uncharacterized protein APUU_50063A [Aspergillus puulaauensis]BCS25352.1 hypothetical protein APUU_50063A [Aspergillus puulaauensis]
MPLKRKASQDNIAETKVETRSARRRKIKETGHLPPDPLLSALPWDCASLIFDYLELPDLARCEQVSQGWKTFVQRWMVARGHYLHLPESLRPDFGAAKTMERQVAMVKRNVVHLQKYNKIASGRASSVRIIQNAQSLEVNGDFAAWVVRHRLYGQRLGFQADGSPYRTRYWDLSCNCNISGNTIVHVSPGGYVVVRVSNHSGYLDRIVSISTGTHLWRRASEAGVPFTDWPEIRGIGATRLYSVQREEGSMHQAYLLVHELATGTLLYRSHVRDYHRIREPSNSFCVRRIGNREVLVVFSVPPTETSPESPNHVHPGQKKLEGFLVINPEDGSTLQRFDAPFCQDKHRWVSQHYVESRIVPWTESEGVFAVSAGI